jgi:hypothetical protein
MIIAPILTIRLFSQVGLGIPAFDRGNVQKLFLFLSRKRKGKPRGITAATDGCVCQSVPTRDSPQKTQPMIPAQDRSGSQVFAGTW